MAIIYEQVYEAGEVYGVDSMENVPKDIYADYFDSDFEEHRDDKEHELGSALCCVTFKLTIQTTNYADL